MRKFFSRILVLFFLIAILLAIAPYVTGIWIQHNYLSLLSKLDSNTKIDVQVIQYNRGWLSSNAIVKITFPESILPPSMNSSASLTLPLTIMHGPVIFDIQSWRKTKLAIAEIISAIPTSNGTNVNLETLVKVNRDAALRIYGNDIQLADAQLQINIKNLDINTDVTQHYGRFSTNAMIGSISSRSVNNPANTSPTTVQLSGISIRGFASHQGLLWLGNRTINVALIQAQSANTQLKMSDFELSARQFMQNDALNLKLINSIHDVSFNQSQLSNFKLNFSLQNLDAMEMQKLTQFLYQTPPSTDASGEQLLHAMGEALLPLMNKGMNINIDALTFNTAEGPVNFVLMASVPKQIQPITDWMSLLQTGTLSTQINLPKTWVSGLIAHYATQKQIPNVDPTQYAEQTLNQWQAAGMLVPDQNNVSTKINYQGQKWQVNGQAPNFTFPVIPATQPTATPATTPIPTTPTAAPSTTPTTTATQPTKKPPTTKTYQRHSHSHHKQRVA